MDVSSLLPHTRSLPLHDQERLLDPHHITNHAALCIRLVWGLGIVGHAIKIPMHVSALPPTMWLNCSCPIACSSTTLIVLKIPIVVLDSEPWTRSRIELLNYRVSHEMELVWNINVYDALKERQRPLHVSALPSPSRLGYLLPRRTEVKYWRSEVLSQYFLYNEGRTSHSSVGLKRTIEGFGLQRWAEAINRNLGPRTNIHPRGAIGNGIRNIAVGCDTDLGQKVCYSKEISIPSIAVVILTYSIFRRIRIRL